MIKLALAITRNNLFIYKKSERSPQKPLRILCQSVLIPRKISDDIYRLYRENMNFEEIIEEIKRSGKRYTEKFLVNCLIKSPEKIDYNSNKCKVGVRTSSILWKKINGLNLNRSIFFCYGTIPNGLGFLGETNNIEKFIK